MLKKEFELFLTQLLVGAYILKRVIMMPSYVNIGAYVDEGTMVDTWATVGSCAQIGKDVQVVVLELVVF
jgi:2,3,4,5-tetrahydropyridine-2,6-dicarboxylate N-succinyltransferase